MGFAEVEEGWGQHAPPRLAPLPPPPTSTHTMAWLPRPHLQFFVVVAQEDELWVSPWEVFHYQVVTGVVVKVDSGGLRQVGSPTYVQQVNSTAPFAQVGQGSPYTLEEVGVPVSVAVITSQFLRPTT